MIFARLIMMMLGMGMAMYMCMRLTRAFRKS